MRIGWENVGKTLEQVLAEKLRAGRLDGLELIGVHEASYGADHKLLTCVANHQTGGIVWATEGRNAATVQAFFDGLTDEQKASIKAVSIHMSAGYEKRSAPIRASPAQVVRSCSTPSTSYRCATRRYRLARGVRPRRRAVAAARGS
jgi:transposase